MQTSPPRVLKRPTWRIVWQLLRPRERLSVFGLLILALIGVVLETLSLGAVLPVIGVLLQGQSSLESYPFFEQVKSLSQSSLIALVMAVLTVLFALKHLFMIWSSWLQNGFFAKLNVRLTKVMFGSYLYRPYAFHTQHGTPELISNTQSANLVITGAILPLLTMISDVLVGLGLFGLLVVVEPLATVSALVIFGLFGALFQRLTKKQIDTWGHAGIRLRRDALRHLQEGFGGIKELKILNRENEYLTRYAGNLTELAEANRRFSTLQSVPRGVLETLALLGLAVLVVTMSSQGLDGRQILPVVGLFAAGAFRVSPSINRVITAVQQVRFAHPMIVVVDEELRQWSAPTPARGISEEFVSLELQDICFSHPGRDQAVLEKLDLLIQRGERIGVMGESGAGKSTLIDVLLGLHVPDSGNILLNGKPLASDLSRLHQVVGYVPQAVFLSDASIRENVAFGLAAEDINSDLVWSALRLAQLQEFVDGLPDRLNTVVGERGVRLSGGQRQRIGIARALYRMPQVLIFDEATSSLDMATESSFLESVEELGKSHTLLMVAHRNSTLKNCDRIFRLEGGRLQLMSG